MTAPRLAQLGPAYMKDAGLAGTLLEALERLPEGQQELTINQAWLDRHWHHAAVRRVLRDIFVRWDRFPEPLGDFLEACWTYDDDCWHDFVRRAQFLDNDDLVEDLAEAIHDRLLKEGPTPHVFKTMMMMRGCYAASVWSFGITGILVNAAMKDPAPPSNNMLTLWWRYNPNDVGRHAIARLEGVLQEGGRRAAGACRVVHGLPMYHLSLQMMRSLVEIAQGRASIGSAYAIQTLIRASGTRRAKCVAEAVSGSLAWCEYMGRLSIKALWHMATFMRDTGAFTPMIKLYNDEPERAIRTGLFARILESDPSEADLQRLRWVRPLDETSAEATVHCLHAWGSLDRAGTAFSQAVQAYPRAVAVLARHSPWVRTEMTWQRRKLLLCCLARGDLGAVKRPAPATRGLLATLAMHECMWAPVLAFL